MRIHIQMNISKVFFFCNFYLYIAGNKQQTEHARYIFRQISKFLEDSVDIFYGTKDLKSIDYSKTIDFRPLVP